MPIHSYTIISININALLTPSSPLGLSHAVHVRGLQTAHRDAVRTALASSAGIRTAIPQWWRSVLTRLPAAGTAAERRGHCSIPVWPALREMVGLGYVCSITTALLFLYSPIFHVTWNLIGQINLIGTSSSTWAYARMRIHVDRDNPSRHYAILHPLRAALAVHVTCCVISF